MICVAILDHDPILTKNIFQYIYFDTNLCVKNFKYVESNGETFNIIKGCVLEYMLIWYEHREKIFNNDIPKLRKEYYTKNDFLPSWVSKFMNALNIPFYAWGIPPINRENKTFLQRSIYLWKGDLDFV